MDLEAAKLSYGRMSRYAVMAAFVCLLLTATFLIAASLRSAPGMSTDLVSLLL